MEEKNGVQILHKFLSNVFICMYLYSSFQLLVILKLPRVTVVQISGITNT